MYLMLKSVNRRCLKGIYRHLASIGGVFPVLIYDNLTTAVEKVLPGKAKEKGSPIPIHRNSI